MPSSLAARDFRSDRWFLRPRYCPENQIGQAQREQPTYLRQRDLGNSAVARCQVVWLLAISDRIVGFCVLDIVRRIRSDKLNANSLLISGNVILETVRLLDAK